MPGICKFGFWISNFGLALYTTINDSASGNIRQFASDQFKTQNSKSKILILLDESRKDQHQQNDTCDDPVDAENLETIQLEIIDKEAHSQHGDDKSHQVSD
jgi:hypothetical protein